MTEQFESVISQRMEQRDYIMREIEKIGALLRAIRRKLFGGKKNEPLQLDLQIDEAKEELLRETNFDLDKFLNPDTEFTSEYILGFAGFSAENIELLADFLSEIGFHDECGHSELYLEKALQLYHLSELKSNVYSFERENKIKAIKNSLHSA